VSLYLSGNPASAKASWGNYHLTRGVLLMSVVVVSFLVVDSTTTILLYQSGAGLLLFQHPPFTCHHFKKNTWHVLSPYQQTYQSKKDQPRPSGCVWCD